VVFEGSRKTQARKIGFDGVPAVLAVDECYGFDGFCGLLQKFQ
jgi:hypothetical protein